MRPAHRIILILTFILLLPLPGRLSAQQTPAEAVNAAAPPEGTERATAAVPEVLNAELVVQDFSELLRRHPRELARILVLDPDLLANQAFLAQYPELARFIAAHPEVLHNPSFYLRQFQTPESGGGVLGDILEALTIFAVFALIFFALAWFVRTIIEQKRWNWLSRTQNEVHSKILDRLGSSAELLEYIKTPVGTRFLEAAPIPLHTERAAHHPPLNRVLWSIQVGVVVAAAAIGMLIVSGRLDKESSEGMFAMGVIAFSVGAGFIGSAAVSLFLSRRLGLWQPAGPAEAAAADRFDDPGLVR